MTQPGCTLDADGLGAQLDLLAARRSAAMRALYVADDPNADAADLGEAVAADPILSAQVMRLANSAYYGLSGRVGSVEFAVTVLGFATIRSMVAVHAVGGLGNRGGPGHDFWERSARVAAASAQVSALVGLPRTDAFSLGLLHDIGVAVLHQFDAERWAAVPAVPGREGASWRLPIEARAFGMDHTHVGGTVLGRWHFPADMVEAVATHHAPSLVDPTPSQRCLQAALALEEIAGFPDRAAFAASLRAERLLERVRLVGIEAERAFTLSRTLPGDGVGIAAAFSAATAA